MSAEDIVPMKEPEAGDVAEARKLYGVKGNAMIVAFLLACWLLFQFFTKPSGRYYSREMELFFSFLVCGVPALLFLLYVILICVIPRKLDGRPIRGINNVVAIILSVPIGVMFYAFAFFYLDRKNYEDSPFAFALSGIYILFFAVMLFVFLVFYLLNARLIAFWFRSKHRGGICRFLMQLFVLIPLFAVVLGLDWTRLTLQEQQHRHFVLDGEHRILAMLNRHELLLLSRSGGLFLLNPESRESFPIEPERIKTEFPDIARSLQEKAYESIDALSPVWLKRMPGYPEIERTATSPDARWKITTQNQGISILTDNDGKIASIRLVHGVWVACQMFTPDGKYVVVQGNREFVVLSDVPIKLNRTIVWKVPET